jgi:predicted TIM-barrel fold metal-dependent hydrolase
MTRPWLEHLKPRQHRIVIDADTHASELSTYGERPALYYHGRPLSAEEIIAEMDGAGVDMANIWQNPAATRYPGDTAGNYAALLAANEYVYRKACQHPQRLLPSGWTDPQALGVDGACRLATHLVRQFGFAIVKMNPAQNRYPMDSAPVIEVVDHIVSLGATPAFHYGADTPFTPASGLAAIAARLGNHPVLAVHMGGGGAGYREAERQYHDSIALGLEHPNIHYIFSALRDTYIASAVQQYAAAGQGHRLFCASDAPYGHLAWNYGGFRALLAALGVEPAGYLGTHYARFLLAAYRRLGIE